MDYSLIVKHCRRTEEKLFNSFDKRKSLLLDVAREFYPIAIPGLSKGVEELADGYVYDEDHRMLTVSPLDYLRRGASGFHGNLTSPATRWFRFRLPSFMVKDGKTTHDQRVLLDNVTEATEWAFERSRAYQQLHKIYEHVLCFGFGCMIISGDLERIARCETLRIGTYALGIGDDGMVDTCVRRFAWTASQIIRNFGRSIVPQYILDAENDPSKRFEVCNLIEPNAVGDEKAFDSVSKEIDMDDNTVYRSLFWLKSGNGESRNCGFLRANGFSIRPIVAPRMEFEHGDIYGRGRGIDALDLARGCQSFKFDELNIVGRQSEPAMLADAELKDEGLKLYRGAVNYARFGEQRNSMAMPVNPNPPTPNDAREERLDAQQEIAKLFYNDAFSVIESIKDGNRGNMTATEVNAHVREAMQRLAPVATIFDSELLDPLVSILSKYAISAMPTPLTPEQANSLSMVNVEYVSAIHLAQKQSQISSIQQGLQTAAAMAGQMGMPQSLHRIDSDKSLCTLLSLIGYPENCLASDEKYEEALNADRMNAERQAQLQQMQIQAGAAKQIGDIPLDKGHAGSHLAESIGLEA